MDTHAAAPAWQAMARFERVDFLVPDDVVYLNAASHGPRLARVQQAARRALDAGTTPWRLDMDAWHASIEDVRRGAAGHLDGDADGIALVPSVAYGLSLAARNLPLAADETVLVLAGQFPSNLLPWQQRCRDVGARLEQVARPVDADGRPGDWSDAVVDAIARAPHLRIAALPQVHWHDGSRLDLDRIAAATHARGAALVLDLSQSLGALPADIVRWRPDFVASVGHKWLLGAYGLAYLWASPAWRERGVALEQHWIAREAATVFDSPPSPPPLARGARRFDAGGVAEPQRLAMSAAAFSQLRDWGLERVHAGLQARGRCLREALRAQGLGEWLAAAPGAHFLGLRPPPERLAGAAAALDRAGVIHTARGSVLRLAPHLHVDDAALAAVAALLARSGG
ncbi:aminotransferase class V-fold PLP-dependent enzyme [Marilutibacter spongiae]